MKKFSFKKISQTVKEKCKRLPVACKEFANRNGRPVLVAICFLFLIVLTFPFIRAEYTQEKALNAQRQTTADDVSDDKPFIPFLGTISNVIPESVKNILVPKSKKASSSGDKKDDSKNYRRRPRRMGESDEDNSLADKRDSRRRYYDDLDEFLREEDLPSKRSSYKRNSSYGEDSAYPRRGNRNRYAYDDDDYFSGYTHYTDETRYPAVMGGQNSTTPSDDTPASASAVAGKGQSASSAQAGAALLAGHPDRGQAAAQYNAAARGQNPSGKTAAHQMPVAGEVKPNSNNDMFNDNLQDAIASAFNRSGVSGRGGSAGSSVGGGFGGSAGGGMGGSGGGFGGGMGSGMGGGSLQDINNKLDNLANDRDKDEHVNPFEDSDHDGQDRIEEQRQRMLEALGETGQNNNNSPKKSDQTDDDITEQAESVLQNVKFADDDSTEYDDVAENVPDISSEPTAFNSLANRSSITVPDDDTYALNHGVLRRDYFPLTHYSTLTELAQNGRIPPEEVGQYYAEVQKKNKQGDPVLVVVSNVRESDLDKIREKYENPQGKELLSGPMYDSIPNIMSDIYKLSGCRKHCLLAVNRVDTLNMVATAPFVLPFNQNGYSVPGVSLPKRVIKRYVAKNMKNDLSDDAKDRYHDNYIDRKVKNYHIEKGVPEDQITKDTLAQYRNNVPPEIMASFENEAQEQTKLYFSGGQNSKAAKESITKSLLNVSSVSVVPVTRATLRKNAAAVKKVVTLDPSATYAVKESVGNKQDVAEIQGYEDATSPQELRNKVAEIK